jgi:hypothetical protein
MKSSTETITRPTVTRLLDKSLFATAAALINADLTLHVPVSPASRRVTGATHFYVSQPDAPGVAIVSRADFPLLGEKPFLSAPVKPNKKSGSAIAIDYNETTKDAVMIQPPPETV